MRSLTVPENEQLTRLGVGSDAGTGGHRRLAQGGFSPPNPYRCRCASEGSTLDPVRDPTQVPRYAEQLEPRCSASVIHHPTSSRSRYSRSTFAYVYYVCGRRPSIGAPRTGRARAQRQSRMLSVLSDGGSMFAVVCGEHFSPVAGKGADMTRWLLVLACVVVLTVARSSHGGGCYRERP